MVGLYGIATCDSCRAARRWLAQAGIEYTWVDLRAHGVAKARLARWRDALGVAVLVNKRSKTWRDFDARQRQRAGHAPIATLAAHPTLIKRPILETDTAILAGFSASRYATALAGGG